MRIGWLWACLLLWGCASSRAPGFDRASIPEAWSPSEQLEARSMQARATPTGATDGPVALTPWGAARTAVELNPELRVERARRGLAGAEVIAAGILPNPQLDGHYSAPLAGDEATVHGYGAGVSWEATSLLGLGARQAAADHDRAAVDLEIAWREWQVAMLARLEALRVIYATRRLEVARRVEATWNDRVGALERAEGAGAVTALEARDASLARAEAQIATRSIERELATARGALAAAMGVDTSELPPAGGFSPALEAPPVADLLAALPDRRLDLIALRHRYRARGAALDAANAGAFPPIHIGVFVNQEVDENLSAGPTLSLQLPLFDRNQGEIARADARLEAAEGRYEARLRHARADVVSTDAALERARAELDAASRAAARASELGDRARRAMERGALTLLQLQEIERRAAAVELRRVELEQSVGELRVGLATASGTPL